jgi:hypothetical protein
MFQRSKIEEFENTFVDLNRTPNLRIDKLRQLIFVRGTRTTRQLPISSYSQKRFDVQDVLKRLKEDFFHTEEYDRHIPFGIDTHKVTIRQSSDEMLYGGGLLVFTANSTCHDLKRTPFCHSVPLGALQAKNGDRKRLGSQLQVAFSSGLIKPGRLVTIRSKQNKFLVPKIAFPYGNNTFEEQLGQFEAIDFNPTISETVIEFDVVMDDLDD